ncbi:MAG TPA: group 1 truncated hemoglobin [Dongiaceae bacterium]|nr:group 1 truncated hemoglobin [Dongiaceae bacterium]
MNAYSRLLLAVLFIFPLALTGCQSLSGSQTPGSQTLYDELGGQPVIEKIADNFINEISFDQKISAHFKDTDIDRFRAKLIEQLCNVSDGPCEYTGDSMLDVHQKMNITENEFNRTVDLLINAMTQAGVSHRTQNKLIARLAPMRPDIIYH